MAYTVTEPEVLYFLAVSRFRNLIAKPILEIVSTTHVLPTHSDDDEDPDFFAVFHWKCF